MKEMREIGSMDTEFMFTTDEWGRARLTASITTAELSHVLVFAEYGHHVWWAKSPNASTEHAYSAIYHHVHENKQRQVIITCGNFSCIDNCVIPSGFEPSASQTLRFEWLIPGLIHERSEHRLGILLIPKVATKTMRKTIWRLKEDYYSASLLPFRDALTHGRRGHAVRESEERV